MYVAYTNQKDWDECAERLTNAIITEYDLVRVDTPFYLIHGWDHERRWKRLFYWPAPNDGTKKHEDGVTIYNVNTSGQGKL